MGGNFLSFLISGLKLFTRRDFYENLRILKSRSGTRRQEGWEYMGRYWKIYRSALSLISLMFILRSPARFAFIAAIVIISLISCIFITFSFPTPSLSPFLHLASIPQLCEIAFLIQSQMGQNSSLPLGFRDVARDWMPLDHDPSIFINHKTRKQLQCFHMEISMQNLLREITIYNARIQAVFPYICRVAYFNQISEGEDNQLKGCRVFSVFTDRLLNIKEGEWTHHRFVHALEAISALNSYYGYFRLTEKMMRVNERGETKVWISENPANNHRDYALANEEQALAAFAGLAVRKNHEVANSLIGCRSLAQALQRLTKPRRKGSFPYNNQSHRTIEDLQVQKRQNLSNYKNVFHDTRSQQKKKEIQTNTFNSTTKDHLKPLSFNTRVDNQMSGRTISQHKVSKVCSFPDEEIIGRNMNSEVFLKGRPESNNIGDTSIDQFSKTPNHKRLFQPSNSFISSKKFSSIPSFNTQKYKQPYNPSLTPTQTINFSPKPERDITIINNNVNHVVNNITLNHNRHNIWSQANKEKPAETINLQAKKDAKSPFDKKSHAPLFIQQRSKANQENKQVFKENIKSFYTKPQKMQENLSQSKPFFRSTNFNSTHASGNNNFSTQQSFRNAEMAWRQPQRKSQKLYTFSRNINARSPNKLFSNTFSPQTPYKPFTPPAQRQQPHTTNTSFFKKPNRTKTTDFNDSSRKTPKNTMIYPLSNANNMQQETFKNRSEKMHEDGYERTKGVVSYSQAIPEEVAQNLPTSKSIAVKSGTQIESTQTKDLKKQLKLEFSSLLGAEPKPQKPEKIQQKAQQTPPQSFLKQKIEQKKQAFAELKKEALAVLTDIF